MNQRRPKREAEPPFLGTFRQAEIDEMTAQIAAGSMDYVIGSGLIRFEDGALLFLQGVGNAAVFKDSGAATAPDGGGNPGGGGTASPSSFEALTGSPFDNLQLGEAFQSVIRAAAAPLDGKQDKLPATTPDGTKVLYNDLQWRAPPVGVGPAGPPGPPGPTGTGSSGDGTAVASASQMTVPSGAGENGDPVPLLRYLRRSPSSIDYSEQRYDEEGNSFGNNVNTVQDWPLSKDFGTLEAAQAVFPFVDSLDDQRDWAELQAAVYAGNTSLLPSDAEGRWLNINRPVYCGAEFTRFVNRRCRIYTGKMPKQAIVDGYAPGTDLSYPDVATDNLGPVAGAVFVFTDLAIEPVLEGIEFDGARFPIAFLAGAVNAQLRNIRAHRSNCIALCYSGDLVNPTLENCGGDELGTLLISSATAYPADHPESGSATNATYGLTAIASEFTPKVYTDFNTWFRNSVMRPAATSATVGGSSTYSGSDLNATGRKVYVPRRNAQAIALTWAALSGGKLTTNALVQAGANDVIDWGALSVAPTPAPPAPAPSPTPAPPPVSSAKTAYLLPLTEAELGTNPAKWGNSVVGGGTFSNVGTGGVVGGQSGTGAPRGRGMWAQPLAQDGSLVAIASDIAYVDLKTIELDVVRLESNQANGTRSLMRWGINPTDFLDFQVRAGGNAYYVAVVLLAGSAAPLDLLITPEVPAIPYAGKSAAYHFAAQHETDGSVSLRGNGSLLGATSQKFTNPFNGLVDPFGSYDRTTQIARGMLYAETSNLRGSYVLRYSGTTYDVPPDRFALD